VTQDALMAKYTQYHNQLKYLKENAQALGLTPEEVKKVNMSMACAEVEFNHAFDPKLQAVKAANEQAQKPASQPEEHKQQPAAVAISDEQKQKALQAAAQFHGAVQGTATYVPAGPQQTGQAQGRA
jgi:lipase chaperone LimK